MKAQSGRWFLVLCATAAVAPAAIAPGNDVYTKRAQTALLSEPQILATPVAQLSYAQRLKVEEIKGGWVRVTDGKKKGWIFAGNLADEKPSETRGLDGLPVAASETSASTAARPLVPAAEEYSARRGLTQAADDVTWMTQQLADITPTAVQSFLQENKKGEFQ